MIDTLQIKIVTTCFNSTPFRIDFLLTLSNKQMKVGINLLFCGLFQLQRFIPTHVNYIHSGWVCFHCTTAQVLRIYVKGQICILQGHNHISCMHNNYL